MASIQKTAAGYRAQIKKRGVRDSRLFSTRREAVAWADARETEITDDRPAGAKHTLRDALRKYATEVSPNHRGERWELVRLAAFEHQKLPLDAPIADLTAQHIADFRDARGAVVGPASVLRELSLLSGVLQTAVIEWGWIDANPCHKIRKPSQPRHRDRTLRWSEIRAMLRAMSYGARVSSVGQSVAVCMLVALATGMRAGELCGMTWDRVHDKYVSLPMTKNGKPRDVPLSRRAVRYVSMMRGWDDESVFGLSAQTLDALFRKYRGRAGLDGFTFHDCRHTAATMLARRVDVLTLCKIMGWSNPKMAMVYFNPKASEIAAMLG